MLLELLTNDKFWMGVAGVCAVVVPAITKYVLAVQKTTKELVELHNSSKEENDAIIGRAKDRALQALNKYLTKEETRDE